MTEYGGTPESFAWFRGRTVPGAAIRLWADRERTTQITTAYRLEDGFAWPDGLVRADTAGWFRFGVDGAYESIYVEAVGGDGALYRIDRADVGARVGDLEQGLTGIAADAAQARTDAAAAVTQADAARTLHEQEMSKVNQPEGLVRLNSAGKVGYGQLPADSAASSFLTWGDYWDVDADHPPQAVGFRGMANLVPENTLEGVAAYLDLFPFEAGAQVPVVWVDVLPTDEAAQPLLATNPPEGWFTHEVPFWEMSTPAIRQLRINGTVFHPRWPELEVPTLEDLFARFAGRCLFVLNIGQNSNVVDHVATTVLTYGMQDSVIVAMYPRAYFGRYDSIRTMAVFEETLTDADLDVLVDQGVEWVALHTAGLTPTNGAVEVAAARARGFKVALWPLERRYELERAQSWGDAAWPWGCDLYVSPDPLYCSYTTRHHDRFYAGPADTGTYTHGQLSNGIHLRKRFHHVLPAALPAISGGGLHGVNNPYDSADTSLNLDGALWVAFENQGWAVPLGTRPDGALEFESLVRFLRVPPAGGSWITFGFGFDSDRPYQYQGTGSVVLEGDPTLNGWIGVLRDDGNIYLRKVTAGIMDGADRASMTTGGGGVAAPGAFGFRVRLTATEVQIILTDTDFTEVKRLTYADTSASHRGPYFAWGTRRNEVVFYRYGAS